MGALAGLVASRAGGGAAPLLPTGRPGSAARHRRRPVAPGDAAAACAAGGGRHRARAVARDRSASACCCNGPPQPPRRRPRRSGLPAALRRRWSLPLVALLLGAALWALDTPHPGWSLLLCAVWGAAPLWSWLVSRTGLTRQPHAVHAGRRAYLHRLARDTWRYFERASPPPTITCRRTTCRLDRTDAGAPHVAHQHRPVPAGAAARASFGWIDTPSCCCGCRPRWPRSIACSATAGTSSTGTTRHLALLLPAYVSSVDSGNLSGHLLAVAQACRELAGGSADAEAAPALEPSPGAARRWPGNWTSPSCTTRARHLLHIGLRVAEQQLDASFYDLLASESRLTSLLAIAKGDVPCRHWVALGRPFFGRRSRRPEVVVGVDVRVPDAHAGAGRTARQRAA